jgi:hypothetical protein
MLFSQFFASEILFVHVAPFYLCYVLVGSCIPTSKSACLRQILIRFLAVAISLTMYVHLINWWLVERVKAFCYKWTSQVYRQLIIVNGESFRARYCHVVHHLERARRRQVTSVDHQALWKRHPRGSSTIGIFLRQQTVPPGHTNFNMQRDPAPA